MFPNKNITFYLALLLFSWCTTIEACGEPSIQPYVNGNTLNGHGGANQLSGHDELMFNKTEHVIGGTVARPHSWPWMVLLYYQTRTSPDTFLCGATIISEQWVMTAAHCAQGMIESSARAYVGIQSQNEAVPSNDYGIRRKIVHPQYNYPSELSNDIALLQLSSKLSFSRNVQPICLPSDDSTLSRSGQSGYVTGWGQYTVGNQVQDGSSPELLQAQVPIIDQDTCRAYWRSTTSAQVCAGAYLKGTGGGDSGGPLEMRDSDRRWFQVGITSYGGAGDNGLINQGQIPGVYTRVSSYCDFIHDNTNGDVTCSAVALSISIFVIFFCSMIMHLF